MRVVYGSDTETGRLERYFPDEVDYLWAAPGVVVDFPGGFVICGEKRTFQGAVIEIFGDEGALEMGCKGKGKGKPKGKGKGKG